MEFGEELMNQNMLDKLVIGYPRFKLRRYEIEKQKLSTFPFIHASLMKLHFLVRHLPRPVQEFLLLLDVKSICLYARLTSSKDSTYVTMSGLSHELVHEPRLPEQKIIIFRASRHIVEQNQILEEASMEFDIPMQTPSPRMIEREISEYQIADLIFVPSEICAESFMRQGVDPNKVKVLYFPHTLNDYSHKKEVARDGKKVTFVGNVSVQKGIITLLKAWKLLGESDLTLTIIGRTDPTLMAFLSDRKLVSNNVIFTNHLDQYEIEKHLSQTSLFVMPSIQEGWPMALMEAISMECPTLISNAICKSHELPNPDMNFLFQSGDELQLSQMISHLMSKEMQKSLEISRTQLKPYPSRTWSDFVKEFHEIVDSNEK
jgi:glycosyltransferase involved in cell wall biosynthesis